MRIAGSPRAATSFTRSLVKQACPQATPGEATTAFATGSAGSANRDVRATAVSTSATRASASLRPNDALLNQIDGDLQRSQRRALGRSRLQEPEPAAFDRELHVLHVAAGGLKRARAFLELPRDLGHAPLEQRRLGRRTAARNEVFALSVGEEVDVELLHPRRGIAREGDPGPGIAARITERHRLDSDGGAFQALEGIEAPVFARPRALPRPVDRVRGLRDLVDRIERRRVASMCGQSQELLDQALERLGIEFRLVGDALGGNHLRELVGEATGRGASDHFGVGLDEPPVAVEGHPRIAGQADEAVDARLRASSLRL